MMFKVNLIKFLTTMSTLLAIAAAQYGYPYGFGLPQDEEYAASLAGAPVGLYGKKSYGGPGGVGGYSNSEVSGASLSGAKVGLYGKEHGQQRPVPLPVYPEYRSALPLPYPSYIYPGYRTSVPVSYPRPVYSKYLSDRSYKRTYPRKIGKR